MLIRVIFFLLCAAGFINSCNSLISLQVGTHKLRSFTVEEIEKNGIKDADYIEITDANIPAEFIQSPIQKTGDKAMIIYPILSSPQSTYPSKFIKIIAWEEKEETACIEQKNCLIPGVKRITGVVRPIKKRRNTAGQLAAVFGKQLAKNPVYIKVGETPIAWYWHALVMLLTAGAILLMEAKRF